MPAAWFLASFLSVSPLAGSAAADPGARCAIHDEVDDKAYLIGALAEKKLFEQVVREGEAFLADHAAHAKAPLVRYRLANAFFELGRLADARPHFARLDAAEGFRYAAEVAFRLGQCALEAGDNDAAAAALARAREGEPTYLRTPATFLEGEAHFRAGRFAEASALYARVLAAEDGEVHARDARYALAWCAYRRQELAGALREIATYLQEHGQDERLAELAFLAGECQLELERPEEALSAYSRVESGPFHDAALRGAGFAHAALGAPRRAAETFGRLLERYPGSRFAGEATLHRGIQLLEAGDADAALAALDAPTAVRDAEHASWRARALAELGRHTDALEAAEAGLAADPAPALAARLAVARADALFALGRTEEAARVYETAGSDYALHAAAVARLNDGDAAEAARLAAPLAAGDGRYRLAAALTLGEARFVLEDWAGAEEAFAVVVAGEAPEADRARAAARLGWCRYLAGDPAAARKRFEAAARQWPDAADADEARFLAARIADELGAGDAAEALAGYLRERGDSGRFRAEADLRLARLEDGPDGEKRLAALVARDPAPEIGLPARFELAERLAAREAWGEAATHYAALLEAAPAHALAPGARYGLAWCLHAQGDDARALPLLEAIGAEEGDLGELAELAGAAAELAVWCARGAGEPDRARAAWARFDAWLVSSSGAGDEDAASTAAERLRVARVAAAALTEAGREAEADEIYAQLLASTRERGLAVAACVERTYLALDRGDVDAAEAHARAALEAVPEDVTLCEALFFVGEARFAAGDDDRASALYALAAAGPDPDVRSRALYKEGFAHLRADRHAPAAAAFGRLVDAYPDSELFGEALFLAGEAHFRAGRDGRAIELLARVRAEVPRHAVVPKALFRLGVAYAREARWREAAETLGVLAQRHPDFDHGVEAELWRGRALAGLDERRAARAAFERVVARDEGVLAARAHLELGRLSLAEGERDDALSKFLYVAVLFAHAEEVAEALFHAGAVLEDKGDRESAVARYREAVAQHPETEFGARARQRLAELGERGG